MFKLKEYYRDEYYDIIKVNSKEYSERFKEFLSYLENYTISSNKENDIKQLISKAHDAIRTVYFETVSSIENSYSKSKDNGNIFDIIESNTTLEDFYDTDSFVYNEKLDSIFPEQIQDTDNPYNITSIYHLFTYETYPYFYEMDITADAIFILESCKYGNNFISKRELHLSSKEKGVAYERKSILRQIKMIINSELKMRGDLFSIEQSDTTLYVSPIIYDFIKPIIENFSKTPWNINLSGKSPNHETRYSYENIIKILGSNPSLLDYYYFEHLTGLNTTIALYDYLISIESNRGREYFLNGVIDIIARCPNTFGKSHMINCLNHLQSSKNGSINFHSQLEAIIQLCNIERKTNPEYYFDPKEGYIAFLSSFLYMTNAIAEKFSISIDELKEILSEYFSIREKELDFHCLATHVVSPYEHPYDKELDKSSFNFLRQCTANRYKRTFSYIEKMMILSLSEIPHGVYSLGNVINDREIHIV